MAIIELFSDISWISMALFVLGLGLCIAEMFDPGFGVFGIFGILSFVACIFVTADTVAEGIILTVFFAVIILIMLGIFMVLVSRGKLPDKLVLREAESKRDGFAGTRDLSGFAGKTGIIITTCRPVGNADFDGVKIEVVSRGEYIEKGEVVEVSEVEGNRVVVKSVTGNTGDTGIG